MQLLMGLWSIPLLWILHEGGHWIAAKLLTGRSIHFNWKLEFKVIPVGHWYMPSNIPQWKKNVVWFSGFGLEFAAIPFLPLVYGICVLVHFITYPLRQNNAEAKFWKTCFFRIVSCLRRNKHS